MFPAQELLDFHYRVLDYQNEKPLSELAQAGFSSDYVYREAKRAREGLAGAKTQLWPGIDIDIPTAATSSKSTPDGTRGAVVGGIPRRGGRRDSLAQVERDEERQPEGRRCGNSRVGAGVERPPGTYGG